MGEVAQFAPKRPGTHDHFPCPVKFDREIVFMPADLLWNVGPLGDNMLL